MRKIVLRVGLVVLLALFSSASWADDTEIFGAGLVDVEPNILIIFDNSGSMDGLVDVPVEAYDPSRVYPGSYSTSRVYYSTLGWWWFTFEHIGSNNLVDPGEIACTSARNALNTLGHWQGRIYTSGSHNCSSWASSRMLRTGNYRNYLSTVGSGQRPKLAIAKEVVIDIIDTTPGVRFGLMVFNNNEGGRLQAAIKTRTSDTEIQDLKNKVNALDADTWTPLGETLAEAGLYFARKDSWSNSNIDYGQVMDIDGDGSDDEYAVQWRCQKNYAIIMTDGMSTQDRGSLLTRSDYINNKSIGDYDKDNKEPGSYSSYGSDYLDDVAAFLYNEDLIIGSLTDAGGVSFDDPSDSRFAKQNVITYTVGFDLDDQLLKDTSDQNHGQGDYFTTTGGVTLTEIFQAIIGSIQQSSAEFVAPVVPVNRINKTFADNGVYLGIFSPDGQGLWKGNLKKYGLAGKDVPSQGLKAGDILDRHGNTALNANGMVKDGAHSCWGTEVTGTEGMSVDKGGVGAVLLKDTSRTFYTHYTDPVSGNTALESFAKTNTHITAAATGAADDTEKNDLVDFARAEGIYAPTANGDNDQPREWVLGDILHSRPAILYDTTNNRNVILVGANDGFLHCFVDSDYGTNDYNDDLDDDDVEEAWAYIPWDLMLGLPALPLGDGIHDYFIDGTPVVFQPSANTSYVTCGLRRGGNRYYTLNVSNYTSPSFAWEIEPDILGTDPVSGHNLLGQSWCTPRLVTIKRTATDTSGIKVMLLAGGYDENQDLADPGANDNYGRAIYGVQATDGALYSKINFNGNGNTGTTYDKIKYCITDLTSFDYNDDGFDDTIYAGTLGGGIFVFHDRDHDGNWQARQLFRAANDGGTNRLRKFINAPSITQETRNLEYLYVGTGDREDPTRETVDNQFYAIKNQWPSSWSDAADTLEISDLVDITSDSLQDTTASEETKTAVLLSLQTCDGWRIDMEHVGEKVVSSPVVFDKVVYFTTYTPSNVVTTGDKCSTGSVGGTARMYAMDYKTGVSVFDFDDDGTLEKTDRSIEIGGGIPSEPVVVVTEKGAQVIVGTQGGVFTHDITLERLLHRGYWLETY